MTALVPIETGRQGQPVVSTLDVASGLGVRHKSLIETIRTYQQAVEENFGLVAFETAPAKQKDSPFQTANLPVAKRGTKPMTIAYLTEDQALFIGTLSRNSKRVVEFKSVLVRSFAEVRRQLRESVPDATHPLLAEQSQRIAHLEQKLQRLVDVQVQAGRTLLELPRSSEVPPEESTRKKIQRIVNAYCRSQGLDQQTVWRRVYDRLYYAYRISIRAHHKRNDRESWLDVAERKGYLDKIFAIVSEDLVLTP